MAKERRQIDISQINGTAELRQIIEELRALNESGVIERDGEELAILSPAPRPKRRSPRTPRKSPLTLDDPLFELIGTGRSEGPTDVSANKHAYLADAYADLHK